MNDVFASFIVGVLTGASLMFFIIFVSANASSTQYEFVTINGLSCLEVDSHIVSCNWEEWQK